MFYLCCLASVLFNCSNVFCKKLQIQYPIINRIQNTNNLVGLIDQFTTLGGPCSKHCGCQMKWSHVVSCDGINLTNFYKFCSSLGVPSSVRGFNFVLVIRVHLRPGKWHGY